MPTDDVQPSTVEVPPPPLPVRTEFDESRDQVFTDLARRGRSLGGWFLVLGVITIVGFVRTPSLVTLIAGLVLVMVGIWWRRVASGFDAAAKTEQGDIGQLLATLRELAKLYGLLDRIILIAVVLAAVILIAGLGASIVLTGGRH